MAKVLLEGTELISLVLEARTSFRSDSLLAINAKVKIGVGRLRLVKKQKPNCVGTHRRFHNERTYQNPSIVKLHQLRFELENNHEEDPAHDDATVLDNQRGLGHCGQSVRRVRTWSETTDSCLGQPLIYGQIPLGAKRETKRGCESTGERLVLPSYL